MVQSLTIDELCDAAYANADAKGFHPPELTPPETLEQAILQLQELRGQLRIARFFQRLFLVISEIVEAGEDWRKGGDPAIQDRLNGKPIGIPSEIADVFIRLGDMCKEYGIPIGPAIAQKMAFNTTRPHMHGGKLA